jgi:hypothetical protein
MSIKRVKPTKNSGYVQGYFNPKNVDKYVGPEPIIFRSSWERKFMIWCDNNPKVLRWSSEPIQIKYWSSIYKKEKTYHPDFYVLVEKEDGSQKQLLVEVKPESHIKKPQPPKTNSRKAVENYKYLAEQYVTNRDKYVAAQKYAIDRGWQFVVMTENSIK